MLTWRMEALDGQDMLTCPQCERHFYVDAGDWPGESQKKARSCPFCFMVSMIPGAALLYDGTDTLRLSEQQAYDLTIVGMIRYSPHDGPNGIMYRPAHGYTIEQVKNALV